MAIYPRSDTNNPIRRVFIRDTTVTDAVVGLTGLDHESTGLRVDVIRELDAVPTSYTVAATNLETITTLGTYAAPTAGKARFKEVDATAMPGWYELHFAQALFGAGDASRFVGITLRGAADMEQVNAEVQINGGGDWSEDERKQIRSAVGIDGDKVTATGGQLQGVAGDVDAIRFGGPSGMPPDLRIEIVVDTGATGTSIPIKSSSPTITASNQFGAGLRTLIFTSTTVTAALRGRAARIISSTTGALTLHADDALSPAPAEDEEAYVV